MAVLVGEDGVSLDPDVIAGLRSLAGPDEPNFFAELVSQFLGHADGAIAGLRAAAAAGDGKRLADLAHGLKGSSGNMGAKRMQAMCGDLQTAGSQSALAAVAPAVEALAREYGVVRARLAVAVGGSTAPRPGSGQAPPTDRC